ncbi:hypothetical protein [Paraburkholderia youngii]|uniref:hypothetical protein n=1 Tax=Paraburkholderia youngii TaxID=2782701 RepID=UPI003D1ABC5E
MASKGTPLASESHDFYSGGRDSIAARRAFDEQIAITEVTPIHIGLPAKLAFVLAKIDADASLRFKFDADHSPTYRSPLFLAV